MTVVLGLSAHFHDAAAALVIDGDIVAAAEEERFTRKKHDASFPAHALAACLGERGLGLRDVDYVVFYEKPLIKFDRILETYFATAPRGFAQFRRALPRWVGGRLDERTSLRRALGPEFRGEILFVEHHEAHAAAAFFPSPFEEAAILTADGVGEWSTTTIAKASGLDIEVLTEQRFPHSLGLLFNAFTQFLGFEVNEGEYKVMGLAPYGQPRFAEQILNTLLDLKPDGSFRLDLDYFDFLHGLQMISPRFEALFGPRRQPGGPTTQRDVDCAASIQAVAEEVFLRLARTARTLTGASRLCLAGGCAHNSVAAGRILEEKIFDEVWVQPAAGDAGGALGAALQVSHCLLRIERRLSKHTDSMRGAYLGPSISNVQVREALAADGAPFETPPNEAVLLDRVAESLAAGKVIGWFQGRMEFGPRALGARSILADPRVPDMTARVNRSVKLREAFRPFAPAVLRDKAHEWFDVPEGADLPYMTFVVHVRDELLPRQTLAKPEIPAIGGVPEHILSAVAQGPIPAVTHVDGSARVQTVDPDRHGRYERLLRRFYETTGCPVLLNTSFNVRGEPIVCTPTDALRCLRATDIDLLVLGDHLVPKPTSGDKPEPRIREEKPTRSELRRFAGSLVLTSVVLGSVFAHRFDSWLPLLGLAIFGVTSALVCLAVPYVGRWMFRVFQTFGRVLGTVWLAILYFFGLTPIALVRRLFGHDPLQRRRDPSAATYFHEKKANNDPTRAFRSY